jgi:tetratricopeptide (TPR) repeat protein
MSLVQSSNDNSFKVLYKNNLKVDSVMGIRNYLHGLIDFIIAKEEIDPIIFSKTNPSDYKPDWDKITRKISNKYNIEYANRTVTGAKIRWYSWKQDWPAYTKNLVIFVEKYDTDKSAFNLNNRAWAIFEHSNKTDELNAALKWSNYSLKLEPASANWIDTNANILYKLAKSKEAISLEEKAVKLEPENQEFKINLEKMKNGVSTWE